MEKLLYNDHYGKSFLGKGNKNVVSKSTNTIMQTSLFTGGVLAMTDQTVTNFTYEVDTDGYILKEKRVYNWVSLGVNGTTTGVYDYIYE